MRTKLATLRTEEYKVENTKKDDDTTKTSALKNIRSKIAYMQTKMHLHENEMDMQKEVAEERLFRYIDEKKNYRLYVRYDQVNPDGEIVNYNQLNRIDRRIFYYNITGKKLKDGLSEGTLWRTLGHSFTNTSDYDVDLYGHDYAIDNIYEMNPISKDDIAREGEPIGHHHFGVSFEEIERFQMFPLRLHDFPCIYESLMIIKYYIESNGYKPPITYASWLEYVLFSFNNESDELIYNAVTGLIIPTIDLFNVRHDLNIGFFNIHKFDEYEDVITAAHIISDINEYTAPPQYFLAYWKSHVFPIMYSYIPEIKTEMKKYVDRFTTPDKYFCVLPGILRYLRALYKLFLAHANQDTLPAVFHMFNMRDIFPLIASGAELPLTSKYYEKYIRDVRDDHRNIYTDEYDTDRICEIINANKGTLSRGHHSHEDYTHAVAQVMRCIKGQCWFPELYPAEELKSFIEKRHRKVYKIGWCGIDIETLIDNTLSEYSTNFRPYCLSIYGRLQRVVIMNVEYNDRKHKIQLDTIEKTTFWGLDCVEQFIYWIVRNNYLESDMNYYYEIIASTMNKKRKKVINYFFAHNGFKFDYKFLYEKIYSYVGDMVIVGDIQQTKAFIGYGLNFYDTALFFPQRLGRLAEQFFPQKETTHRKLDGDLAISLSIDQFTQLTPRQIAQIRTYCEYDAFLVQYISESFFEEVYTTPFGHGFTTKIVHHSAPSLSWDVWENCFLKTPIFINPACYFAEKLSYRGGLAMVTKVYVQIGAVYDINSSFPAAMYAPMPIHYVNYNREPLIFDDPVEVTRETISVIVLHNLYLASFEFPAECLRPTIAIKTKDTMICPLSTRLHGNHEPQWLWGVELEQAIRLADAHVILHKVVEYVGDYTHRDFVEYMYRKRYEFPERDYPIKNKLYKLFMVSLYGKHGYHEFDTSMMGSAHFAADMLHQLDLYKENIDDLKIEQVLTNEVDLYYIKFHRKTGDINHKGTTVRIASFITAKARCQLFEGIYAIGKIFGIENIAYMDTDSIHIDVSPREEEINARIQNLAENDLLHYETRYRMIRDLFYKTRLFQDDILKLQIREVKDDKKTQMMNFYDNNELGSFKLEKLIINGAYPGAKYYMYTYIIDYSDSKLEDASYDENILRSMCKIGTEKKLKGVPEKDRLLSHVKLICDNMRTMTRVKTIEDIAEIPADRLPVQAFFIYSIFYRVGTGISLSPALKMIRPTLSKCYYDMETGYSRPFESITAFYAHRDQYTRLMNAIKGKFRIENERLFMEKLATSALVQSHKHTTKLARKIAYHGCKFRPELSMFIENRKRFLTKLAKIKYNNIHDLIYSALLETETTSYFFTHLYQLFVFSYEAFVNMKFFSKKGLVIANGYDEYSEDKLRKMSDCDCAQVYAFMMFTNFICRMKGIALTDRLTQIMNSLAQIGIQFQKRENAENEVIDAPSSTETYRTRWRQNIALSLHFLSVPIAIHISSDDDNKYYEIYTNLWRIYKYIFGIIRANTITQFTYLTLPYRMIDLLYEEMRADVFNNHLSIADFHEFFNFHYESRGDNGNATDEEYHLVETYRQQIGDDHTLPQSTIQMMRPVFLQKIRDQRALIHQRTYAMPSEIIDQGALTISKNDIIMVERDEKEDGGNEFDRSGTLQYYHDLHYILKNEYIYYDHHQVSKYITEGDDIMYLVGLKRANKDSTNEYYRDMLNILCLVYAFLYHTHEKGRELFRHYITFFKRSIPQSERYYLFRAAEAVYCEPSLIGCGYPSKSTHKNVRDLIDHIVKYLHQGSTITHEDFLYNMKSTMTRAFAEKMCTIVADYRLKAHATSLVTLHENNAHTEHIITKILHNQLDNELMVSELYQAQYVASKVAYLRENLAKHVDKEVSVCSGDNHSNSEPPAYMGILHAYHNILYSDDEREEDRAYLDRYQAMFPNYRDEESVSEDIITTKVARKRDEKAHEKDRRRIERYFFEVEAEESANMSVEDDTWSNYFRKNDDFGPSQGALSSDY